VTAALNADTSLTATFSLIQHSLTVSTSGAGAVTSSPAGIDCGATCVASFLGGTTITLSANPAPGSVFASWHGACQGTGRCEVALGADRFITASFAPNPPPPAQCEDGIDNDANGRIDFPADPGCSASTDNSEAGGVITGPLQCGKGHVERHERCVKQHSKKHHKRTGQNRGGRK
jgi:hypothetical protein